MIFVGAACKTLIVERDDEVAETLSQILSQFPDNTTIRVKTPEEAWVMLQADQDDISQVCIEGQVWSIPQSLALLRSNP